MNSFGNHLKLTTFGESHGIAIGFILDGVPSGIKIDEDEIQEALDKRRPGANNFTTQRKEKDKAQILSGVFNGFSTGAPIAIIIFNENQKSQDYENIKYLFRPSHADFTYFMKYGIRDYKGGGRSSARETAARVAAGVIASKILATVNIKVQSGVYRVGEIEAKSFDFNYAKSSEIFALDKNVENMQKNSILHVKKEHDSIGGAILIEAIGVPAGLGEPLYAKLDAKLAEALMGINGVKAVEIGEGVNASKLKGSENNDQMDDKAFLSNYAGGILGGISNGDKIIIKAHFKPTPSIFKEQKTRDIYGQATLLSLKGRHDPCIAIRGCIVAEAMTKLVIADMLLLNMSSKIEHVKNHYM